jgi:hypothetical protein
MHPKDSGLMENVNRDPGGAVLHDRRRSAGGARHLGAAMMIEGDITAAYSNAKRAGRAIAHQGEEHSVGAKFAASIFSRSIASASPSAVP